MVDTVLSRDKNWVRWKLSNCPDIRRDSVALNGFEDARSNGKKMCAPKRIRPAPMGSLDLRFITGSNANDGIARLSKHNQT